MAPKLKNTENLLEGNHEAGGYQIWHWASSTKTLQSYSHGGKFWPHPGEQKVLGLYCKNF